jgi:hypothetical protein
MSLLASTMTLVLLATLVRTGVAIEVAIEVTVVMTNQHHYQAKLYWKNPTTHEEIEKATVQPGKYVKIKSHKGHTFVMRAEHPNPMHASYFITDESRRQNFFFALGIVKKQQKQKEQQQLEEQQRQTDAKFSMWLLQEKQQQLKEQQLKTSLSSETNESPKRDAVAAEEATNAVTELQAQQEAASMRQQLEQRKEREEREQRAEKLRAEQRRKSDQRMVIVRNQYNAQAKVYWINPHNEKEIEKATLQPGKLTEMRSQVNHKFMIRTEHPTDGPMHATFIVTARTKQRVDFNLGMIQQQQRQQPKKQQEQHELEVMERRQQALFERHEKAKTDKLQEKLQQEKRQQEKLQQEEELAVRMKKQHQLLEQLYADQEVKLQRKEKEKEEGEEGKRQQLYATAAGQEQLRQDEEEDEGEERKQQDQLRQEEERKQQEQLRQEERKQQEQLRQEEEEDEGEERKQQVQLRQEEERKQQEQLRQEEEEDQLRQEEEDQLRQEAKSPKLHKQQQVHSKHEDHLEKQQPAVGDKSASRRFFKLKPNVEDNKGFVAIIIGIVVMIVVTGVMITRCKQPHNDPNQILPLNLAHYPSLKSHVC